MSPYSPCCFQERLILETLGLRESFARDWNCVFQSDFSPGITALRVSERDYLRRQGHAIFLAILTSRRKVVQRFMNLPKIEYGRAAQGRKYKSKWESRSDRATSGKILVPSEAPTLALLLANLPQSRLRQLYRAIRVGAPTTHVTFLGVHRAGRHSREVNVNSSVRYQIVD